MYTFLSIITPKTKMPSGPTVDQTFPSGKIFGVRTDTTVMLELPLVCRTPDSVFIYHVLWDPLGWTLQEISKRTDAKPEPWGNWSPYPTTPRKRKAEIRVTLSLLQLGQGRSITRFFLLLVNSKQATLIYWGRYAYKQMLGLVRFFFFLM